MTGTERRSWPALLNSLITGADLAADDTRWAMDKIMSGDATSAQIAGFVVALRAKGETPAEVAGLAEGMLTHATRVDIRGDAVDVVGTGGDQSGSVNISTMAALVTAAAGVPVVKHGNRSASSNCGSADVLEALGIALELAPAAVQTCVAELGIGFCFAPRFHPAFRHAGPTRRELGIPTAFNVLGPLTNPAQPGSGLVGCAHERLAPVLAEVFASRGTSALVVRGDDGLDEITTTTTTTAWVVAGGKVHKATIDPRELNIEPAQAADLVGGDASVNAEVVRALVAGRPGPVRDAVLINAAGAIAAYRGMHSSLGVDLTKELAVGLDQAAAAIDTGAAADLLGRWANRSTELA